MFNLFNKKKTSKYDIIGIDEECLNVDDKNQPVTVEDCENLINLIAAAQKANAFFNLKLGLRIDDFVVDSHSLTDIKILKENKTLPYRLLISSNNNLLSTDTTIKIDDIIIIDLDLAYYSVYTE